MINRVSNSFDSQTMMQTFKAKLTSVEHGRVEITAPILGGSKQQHGFAHAALTFALGDSAAGYAALSTMAPEYEVLTSEMKINLLSPGRTGPLRAVGTVEKSGKRLVIVRADIFDGNEKIAILQGTMIPVKGSR